MWVRCMTGRVVGENRSVAEVYWEVTPKRVKVPYAKRNGPRDVLLKYDGARETLSEAGSTTIQG